MTQLHGLSAFPITPADEAGRIDATALRGMLDRLAAAGVDSVGLLGSTGTALYLTRAERCRAVEIAAEALAGRTTLLVGIGALRTDEVVRLGQDARAAGADAVLLAPVSYTPLSQEEVFTHFRTVAEAVALPLCVYDNPATTHFTFTGDLVARLSRLPNIGAIKMPAPRADAVRDQLRAMRAGTQPGFSLGYSVDWHATDGLLAGADAWYSVAAGLFPGPCLEIMAAVRRGDAAAARALDARLRPLWDLFVEFGSLRVIYAAANRLGLCDAAPPRPILPVPEASLGRLGAVLETLGLDRPAPGQVAQDVAGAGSSAGSTRSK